MAKIKHIALSTQDPDKTARFYIDVFGMKEIGKINNPNASGYYLIGFQPSGDTFYPNRGFRRVKVKVTRRGLRVRTRAGFYGVATE